MTRHSLRLRLIAGGADALLSRARADFARGEFRFVAQALSHLDRKSVV